MKKWIKEALERNLPPGYEYSKWTFSIIPVSFILMLIRAIFTIYYVVNYWGWSIWAIPKWEVIPVGYSFVNDFYGVFSPAKTFMLLVIIVGAIKNYRFLHIDGTNGLLRLKRLPNRWEWKRRVFGVPVGIAIVIFVMKLILVLIFWGIYMIFAIPQGVSFSELLVELWRIIKC